MFGIAILILAVAVLLNAKLEDIQSDAQASQDHWDD